MKLEHLFFRLGYCAMMYGLALWAIGWAIYGVGLYLDHLRKLP